MKHTKILDCTLRDGAYLVDKTFGENTQRGIINNLINAGIDIIELGFLQNEGFGEGKSVFKTPKEAAKYIPKDTKSTEFALMADFSRYDFTNLESYSPSDKIQNIRLCFFKHERFESLKLIQKIQAKGYKLFIQPVDILGYSDMEILQLIEIANEAMPFAFSIVDTFGSMYIEDLRRIWTLINHNLHKDIQIGFHSHNNLQLSSALAQEFVRLSQNTRKIVLDATLNGMGRGAGNTCTELVALYMNEKFAYNYGLDKILDSIDIYLNPLKKQCTWGYSIPYYITGMCSAHTNNITYLLEKNNIASKDLMAILDKVDSQTRKRYDYDLLESTYLEHITQSIDDSVAFSALENVLTHKNVLILAPGKSLFTHKQKIQTFIQETKNLIVISVNFYHQDFSNDFMFLSNIKRYQFWQNDADFAQIPKILLSNIKPDISTNSYILNLKRVIKKGWENLDNSMILLLRLLDSFALDSIHIAGFDGYELIEENYFDEELERSLTPNETKHINAQIESMLKEYIKTRTHTAKITCLTESKFSKCL
ncbi:aldolase catalytic domain-containing protein [uncultured Helicobacter sp.]|uniref:aldolase catalytic domain-containing protein n=1 Tax=uncultured Helicobacter sp. TaxID=175537 RepID=UPI0037505472